jgi:hypothetical protein
MRMHRALLLAAVFALSTLDGAAEEKQIVDVKELAGGWAGLGHRSAGRRMGHDERVGRRKLQSFDHQWDDRG